MRKVYLAGPITGCTFDESVDWRDYAIANFAPGISGVTPMRGKDFLKKEGVLQGNYDEPLATRRGILTRDHWDVQHCDVVLGYFLNLKGPTLGTIMELAWAHAYRKPFVAVTESVPQAQSVPAPDSPMFCHPMVREAVDFFVPTLDLGIALVNHVLKPYADISSVTA